MFKIKIEKEFDGTEANFTIDSKESFIEALGGMWDMMAKDLSEHENVWKKFLEGTGFESKEEFTEWFREMKRNGLAYPNFDFDEWMEEAVNTYVKDNTDYYTFGDMEDRISELERAMSDIQDIVNGYV